MRAVDVPCLPEPKREHIVIIGTKPLHAQSNKRCGRPLMHRSEPEPE